MRIITVRVSDVAVYLDYIQVNLRLIAHSQCLCAIWTEDIGTRGLGALVVVGTGIVEELLPQFIGLIVDQVSVGGKKAG